jgi:hypothetical protein
MSALRLRERCPLAALWVAALTLSGADAARSSGVAVQRALDQVVADTANDTAAKPTVKGRQTMAAAFAHTVRAAASQPDLASPPEEHQTMAAAFAHSPPAAPLGLLALSRRSSPATRRTAVRSPSNAGDKLDPVLAAPDVVSPLPGVDVGKDQDRVSLQGSDGVYFEPIEALEAAERAERRNLGTVELMQEMIMGVGGGTGATIGGTGDPKLDKDLLRRMRYQDEAVMTLLLLAYVGSLAFSASIAYQRARNDSPVTYYADPRYHQQAAVEGHDLAGFLETFAQPPKDVRLQVTGLLPMPSLPDFLTEASVEWLGSQYAVAFSFALDLAPWVRRLQDEGRPCGHASPQAADRHEATAVLSDRNGLAAGISFADLDVLEKFLEGSRNDLATVELTKEVEWPDWEELATNIKSLIRQQGFDGTVMVTKTEGENMTVYKNQPWANFMQGRTVKVLCALSIFGWLFYQPYMWIRQTAAQVRVRYHVDVKISDYWPFVSDQITANGFMVRT